MGESLASQLAASAAKLKARKKPSKSIKWCSKCSRYHARRTPCDLYLRECKAKSGRKVARWCH